MATGRTGGEKYIDLFVVRFQTTTRWMHAPRRNAPDHASWWGEQEATGHCDDQCRMLVARLCVGAHKRTSPSTAAVASSSPLREIATAITGAGCWKTLMNSPDMTSTSLASPSLLAVRSCLRR